MNPDQTTPAAVEFGAPAETVRPDPVEAAPVPTPAQAPTPVAAPPAPGAPADDASGLLAMLEADARRDLDTVVKVEVPNRRGWAVGLSTFITQHELTGWEKRAVLKGPKIKTPQGDRPRVDQVRQSALMLLEKCEGIYRQTADGQWVQVMDGEGDPLTLTSDAWLAIRPELRGDTVAALRAWAGDSGVLAIGASLLDAAGWGEAASVVEDPTNG